MNNQRGFFTVPQLSITTWLIIGLVAYSVLVTGLWRWNKADAVKWKAVHYEFVAKTEALGKVAEERARAKEKQDKLTKEKIDREHKTTVANLRSDNERMRNERASRGFLPRSTGSPDSPTVTADRAKLEQALQRLDAGVSQLVGEGDNAIADLNSARQWVRELR